MEFRISTFFHHRLNDDIMKHHLRAEFKPPMYKSGMRAWNDWHEKKSKRIRVW